ncbi:MAG: iron chelate uptake ABC transporter family permease subunit [Desulfovibrio sp.]|jgi:iron complex transport system permease protein|nr:iron chelate uptake ABC transporter family permease subunit [Desulfovibrio sp.]
MANMRLFRLPALPAKPSRVICFWALGLVFCLFSIPLACAVGSLPLSPADAMRALAARFFHFPLEREILVYLPGGGIHGLSPETLILIVADLRLPRILLAFGAGGGLALAGVVFQGILRNPLADPFTLGVSGGAAFGAALAISLGLGGLPGGFGIPLAAFAGAGAALAVVLLISRFSGGLERETLVLAGVVVSAFLAALIALIKALDEEAVGAIVFWLMGSFQGRGWTDLALLLPGLLLGGAIACVQAKELDLLSLGDTTARHLGLASRRSRLILLTAAGAASASCVAVAGIIGFIGLIVPHLCRLLLGARHGPLLPAAFLGGGLLLLWSDAAARSLTADGAELPVGVITALLGGPFFCGFLARNRSPRPGDPHRRRSWRTLEVTPDPAGDPPPPPVGLKVRSLTFSYAGQRIPALEGIDLSLAPGELVGLLGPNGSGKSTLLACIAGLHVPQQGCVLLGDTPVTALTDRERARILAAVPQRTEIPPAFRAMHMVLMGRYARLAPWQSYSAKDKAAAWSALRRAGVAHLADQPLFALSGGELQRVLLARCLAQNTSLLLLDEATAGLDPAYQIAGLNILLASAPPGRSVLAAMHDLNLAAAFCDRLLILKKGRLLADGSLSELFQPEILEDVYEVPVTLVSHPLTGRPQALLGGGRKKAGSGLSALVLACLLSAFFLLTASPSLGGPVAIVDDTGAAVSLPGPAGRIIPLYAALGDTLAGMGLADRIIASTAADTGSPPSLPSIGTHLRPNLESIISLAPDLVVQMRGRGETAVRALRDRGMAVAVFRMDSFADLFSCIERLGILSGANQAAAELNASLAERLEAVRAAAIRLPRRPSVFLEARYPNLLGAGEGNILTEIITIAGGVNCLAGHREKLVRLSEETLLLLDPDIYLVQVGTMNKAPGHPADRPHFRALKAVRRDGVLFVPEAAFSRPGPSAVDAAEDLAKFLRAWAEGRGATEP